MNKKIIYIVCCLFVLFMPVSLVQAKTVEELIEEQNPLNLSVDDTITSGICRYVGEDPVGSGTTPMDNFIIHVNYNKNTKKNVFTTTPNHFNTYQQSDKLFYAGGNPESLFTNDKIYYCPEVLYLHLVIINDSGNYDCHNEWTLSPNKPDESKRNETDPPIRYVKLNFTHETQKNGKIKSNFGGYNQKGESIGSYYPGLIKIDYVCGGIFSDDLLKEIVKIYKTICLVTVAVVIILGILDFMKAISSDDDSALKKAASTFIKRIAIVIILVILPILLQFILTIFGDENMKECLDKIK